MRNQIRSTIHVRVSQPAPPGDAPAAPMPPILDFIASDETLDRYGEVLQAEGWELENYRKNPVIQNAHNYGDVIHTIGKALVTEVRQIGRGSGTPGHPSACLYQRIEFATEANPIARIAYGLYRGGFLNAVSVGFVPLEWEEGNARTPWRRRYLRQELLEVSAVGIPANPNALTLGLKAGAIDRCDLREAERLMRADAFGRRHAIARLLRTLLRG